MRRWRLCEVRNNSVSESTLCGPSTAKPTTQTKPTPSPTRAARSSDLTLHTAASLRTTQVQ